MKELLRFLYPYIRPYWKTALLAVVLSVPLSAIKGAEVWMVKYIVNSLTASSALKDSYLFAGGLLLLGIINYPCRFYHFYLTRYVVDLTTCSLRTSLYRKLQNLPLSFFTAKKSGGLVSNILNDSQMLAQGLKSSIDIFREPLTALVMLGMAIYSDWQLTLVLVLVAPLFIMIFTKSGRKVRAHQEEVQEHLARMTHNIGEGISGQKIIKAFYLRDYVLKRFESTQKMFFKYLMKTTAAEEHAHPMVEFIGTIAFCGVIIFAHYRITSGAITTGDFFSFVTALALMMDPLRKYSQANVRMNQAIAAGKRLFSLMALEEERDQGTLEIKDFLHSIEFQNVSFSYGEGMAVADFSLVIPKGKKVALVGLSGSGKSTLVNLLLRLYPLEHGKILIDGIDIQNYTLGGLRKIFGLVGQDVFLFNDTVQENLTVGETYSPETLQKAIAIAGATEFIFDLPQKINTTIGDRGARLSGGQCQRLTIARAFLQNAPILLFDEATSALDNASEKLIQASLDQLGRSKTVLAVAHRLSTIQDYDSIAVMRGGRKVEQGTHDELMAKKGEYFKLYELGQRESLGES